MHKAVLLMGLGLIINSSAAVAAAPVLQLNARDGAQPRAIDAYSVRPQPDAIAQSTRAAYTPLSTSGAAVLSNAVFNAASAGGPQLIPAVAGAAAYDGDAAPMPMRSPDAMNAASAGLSTAAAGPAAIGAAPKESLFYFVKNFRARPVRQPTHWTIFLVGLCFVLYQIRRRPMRAAIGFNAAARLLGGGNERHSGLGTRPALNAGGMANAVSA